MVNAIDEVSLSIEQANTRVLEISQTAQQLKFEQFDILQEKISAVAEEAEFLIELLSSKELYDDKGQLTAEGKAVMGLHGQNYNVYMAQADKYAEEVERLNAEIAKDPYDQDLINRRDEMLQLQRESILAAEQEKEAIRDMVEEGIQLELDALQELIDKKNEQLQSEKDLYEYTKKVKEQTKEIASLEKQLAAYAGDDSEEAKQKIQKIKVDLEAAKEDLKETEYDKYISDQQKLLDELYLEYEEILNTRLDNIDALLEDMITEINADSAVIGETISTAADSVGYTLSESMRTIWIESANGTNDVITMYGEKFSTAQTTTNQALSVINTNLQNMITQLNTIAKTNVESASVSSAKNSDEANTEKKNKDKDDKSDKDENQNKREITEDTLMGVASAIWVYGGDGSGWGSGTERKNRLTNKLGASNASKVQSYINTHGESGKLYDFWEKKGKNLNSYKYNAFKFGSKRIGTSQLAWTQDGFGEEYIIRPSDGAILTPLARNDSVLNAQASSNIWNMANSPAEFIRDNLSLGSTNIPYNANSMANYTQHLDKVVFNLPNVKNYEELLSAMQKDKNFERLILSMSIDRLAGKSSLAKGKAIR